MAVTYVSSSANPLGDDEAQTRTTTLTVSSAPNRILLIGTWWRQYDEAQVLVVTVNGESGSVLNVIPKTANFAPEFAAHYVTMPAAGVTTVTADWGGLYTRGRVFVCELAGVNQTTPFGTLVQTSSIQANYAANTVTDTTGNDLIVDFGSANSYNEGFSIFDISGSVGAGQTARLGEYYNEGGYVHPGGPYSTVSTQQGGGSVVMDWTLSDAVRMWFGALPVLAASEGETLVFEDTFTDTDDTALSSHTPELGTWTLLGGAAPTIVTNRLKSRPGYAGDMAQAVSAAPLVDSVIKSRWKNGVAASDNNITLIARGDPYETAYHVQWRTYPDFRDIKLYRYVDGDETQIGYYSTGVLTDNAFYDFNLRCSGGVISVEFDGVEVISVDDSGDPDFINTAGYGGFDTAQQGGDAPLDFFRVYSLAEDTSGPSAGAVRRYREAQLLMGR